MNKIAYTSNPCCISAVSLILRLVAGGSMLTHGITKLMSFASIVSDFPNPIGLGSTLSLILVICVEVVCSILLMMGLFTRLATLPLIFNMGVIFFLVDVADPFQVKELALLYLVIFVAILALGAGRFSMDKLMTNVIKDRKKVM